MRAKNKPFGLSPVGQNAVFAYIYTGKSGIDINDQPLASHTHMALHRVFLHSDAVRCHPTPLQLPYALVRKYKLNFS